MKQGDLPAIIISCRLFLAAEFILGWGVTERPAEYDYCSGGAGSVVWLKHSPLIKTAVTIEAMDMMMILNKIQTANAKESQRRRQRCLVRCLLGLPVLKACVAQGCRGLISLDNKQTKNSSAIITSKRFPLRFLLGCLEGLLL